VTATAPRIAVAVVSYETRDLLAECLESLAGDPRLETWVVDNGSGDESADLVRARFPAVGLVARTDNLGFGPAVNLVAERAGRWDWIAALNADTALESGAVDALVEAGRVDPGAGALAPRLVLGDGSTQHSAHTYWSPAFALGFNVGWHRVSRRWAVEHCLPSYWDSDAARHVPWAEGACLLVRREAWEQVGGFDPGQWLYAEDVDLCWRLARAGWATRYVPEARVRHAHSAAAAQRWGDARDERWMAASYGWMLRRRGPLRTRAVALINVAGALARGRRRWARLHAIGLRRRATLRRGLSPD
jgi:GT2 family glycosyltransferase